MPDTFKALTSPTAPLLHHSTDENTEAGRGAGTNLAERQSPGPHSRIMPQRCCSVPCPLLLGIEVTRAAHSFSSKGVWGSLGQGPKAQGEGSRVWRVQSLVRFLTPRSPSPKQPPRPRACGRLLSRLQSPEGPRCPCRGRHRLFGAGVPALLPNLGAANPGPSVAPREPSGGQLHPGLPSASARPRGRLGAGGGSGRGPL